MLKKDPFLLAIILTLLTLNTQVIAKEAASALMRCGAGKCGANMFDGNTALKKKKKNILSQMREGDPRKDCVIKARTTKATYDCVRDPVSKKLTTRCGDTTERDYPKKSKETKDMRCGAQRCGSGM